MTTTSLITAWPAGVPPPALANGVGFALSMVRASDVTDGLSCTFLIGEKNLWPDAYYNGDDGGDDGFALQGFDTDNYRFAGDYQPNARAAHTIAARDQLRPARIPDTPGYSYGISFRQRPSRGLQHGAVRRLGADGELHDRLHDLQPPLQPSRRSGDRPQEGLL